MTPNRVFEPTKYATVDDEVHLIYERRASVQRIAGHEQAIVIDIMGRGRNFTDRAPRATFGFGVYFGPGSDRNISEQAPADIPLNDKAAQLYAAIVAVDVANSWMEQVSPHFHEVCDVVVVKTDSKALVQFISKYVWIWQEEGYVNSIGKPVDIADGWETLHRKCLALEKCGVLVRFWKVRGSQIGQAKDLATHAIEDSRKL